MIHKVLILLIWLGACMLCLRARAQPAAASCAEGRKAMQVQARVTVADPAEDDYDLKHVLIDVAMDNMSIAIRGRALTQAMVVANTMPVYVFELNEQLMIDSVKIDGQLLPFISSGPVHSVMLPSALPSGTFFTAEVFYRGEPGAGSNPVAGIRNGQSELFGAWTTFTLSEPYKARDWWPTKQSLTDKLDSADIHITVPDSLMAGSNGLLQQVVPLPGGFHRFEWKTTYPTAYYLLSASVGPYQDYSFKIGFPGSTDSVLYQNYIYNHPQTLSEWKLQIDSVADMLLYFSELFGRYPFWQEKYGHCVAAVNGGMEHQTMTTQGHFRTTLSAHELAHQWFGDYVTCGSWKDIWLNEGFASYAEYLYIARFRDAQEAFDHMAFVHDEVMYTAGGSVYVDDTTNPARIFDNRLTYHKGAAVIHMLRFVLQDDSLFYEVLRAYLQTFAYGSARTADFQQVAEQTSGRALDTFFNQWLYGEGYPAYSAVWNQVGGQVYIQLKQFPNVPATVPVFHTPVELELISPQGDTTITLYHNQLVQNYSLNWNKPVTDLRIDQNNWLLNADYGTVKDVNLHLGGMAEGDEVVVWPNPASEAWQLSNVPEGSRLLLHDPSGRLIRQMEGNPEMTISAADLPRGLYILRISDNITPSSLKLIKY